MAMLQILRKHNDKMVFKNNRGFISIDKIYGFSEPHTQPEIIDIQSVVKLRKFQLPCKFSATSSDTFGPFGVVPTSMTFTFLRMRNYLTKSYPSQTISHGHSCHHLLHKITVFEIDLTINSYLTASLE